MSMGNAAPLSIAPDERIDTLDVLRGVAICGILMMNIPDMGISFDWSMPPMPFRPNADWIAYLTQKILFSGSMRGLFTLLFGAGMLVMLRRTEREGAAAPMDVFVRRCIALMALGIAQWALLLWPGEILFNYGLTGFFILAFRKARPKTLLAVALTLLALFSLSNIGRVMSIGQTVRAGVAAEQVQARHQPLSTEQRSALDALHDYRDSWNPSPAALAAEWKQRTHFPSVLAWSATTWAKHNLAGTSWFVVLESFIFMLVGMALFRMGILGGERDRSFYLRLALAGYGAGLTIRALSSWMFIRLGTQDFYAPWMLFGSIGYEPARLLTTLGHLGLIVWAFKGGLLGAARPLRALGRMALTTYSLQSILTSILFYGFGTVGRFGFAQLMGITAAIWIVTGLFCSWWMARHEMGPAEWLLRSIAYGRRGGRSGALPVAGPGGALQPA